MYIVEHQPNGVESQFPTDIFPAAILSQNYPNPFCQATSIQFSIPEKDRVSLRIFNSAGQLVTTPVSKEFSAGVHTISWAADDFANGVYFYELKTAQYSLTKKMNLIR